MQSSKLQFKIQNYQKVITYILLAIIVGFGAYLYRQELIIKVDPNDNSFQYALFDEAANTIKEIGRGRLSIFHLFDSFNERWSEGFSLPMYYAHLPQAVGAWLGLTFHLDLYQLFNILKYLALVLMPAAFFVGGRILGMGDLFSLLSALFFQLTFTDGFYGVDSSSFLWRGWGLSSQLFALLFLPLALAYSYRYLEEEKYLGLAILFNFIVAQCHSGVFLMLGISYAILAVFHLKEGWPFFKRMGIFLALNAFFLSYFLIPFFSLGQYRNFSYWDGWWKFNSFGFKQTIEWFFNGALFDFGRWPLVTFFVAFGALYSLKKQKRFINFIGFSFLVYLVLFLGRATLGGLIDLIPGMSEFHLHRFIVLVQVSGIYLAASSAEGLIKWVREKTNLGRLGILGILGIFGVLGIWGIWRVEKPLVKYAQENGEMIIKFNQLYQEEKEDYDKLKAKLRTLPKARIYAGRPGNWGRNFTVGGVPLYMALSQDGFAVIGNAPESWSPNSEFDQFFNEYDQVSYNLYNVAYLVFSVESFNPPKFAQPFDKIGKYLVYKIDTDGWFTSGISNFTVSGKKTYLTNITRLWFGSDLLKAGEYPEVGENRTGKINVKMLDGQTFQTSVVTSSLWKSYPLTRMSGPVGKFFDFQSQKSELDYKVKFKLTKDCPNCLIVLKNTYHPGWQVTINGKKTTPFPVFPYYIGIPVEKTGSYEIVASYKPNTLKVILICLETIVLLYLLLCFGRGLSRKLKLGLNFGGRRRG